MFWYSYVSVSILTHEQDTVFDVGHWKTAFASNSLAQLTEKSMSIAEAWCAILCGGVQYILQNWSFA